MTALAYYARLVDLTTGDVLATTTTVLAFSSVREMDKSNPRSVRVPLGEPGAATDDTGSFARHALAATAGGSMTADAVPTLCEFSLDGGSTIDARFVVEKTVTDLQAGTLTLSGDDPSSQYGGVGPDRFPVRDVALADVLGGNLNAVKPLGAEHFGISSSASLHGLGVIPGFRGLLRTVPGQEPGSTPGSPMWADTARARFAATAVITSALSAAVAFLGCNIDAWEDSSSRLLTSLVKLLAGVIFADDPAPQGSRGHFVWCDSDLNLAADITGVVCDGTPTLAVPAGTQGFSNASTRGGSGASATAVLSGDGVGSITAGGGGTGYVAAPAVSFTGGGGSGAAAVAFVAGGAVTGYAVQDAGVGYTAAPTVVLTSRPAVPHALVIGNVGGHPRGVPFTFDGLASTPLTALAEASTARLFTEQTQLVPDLSPLTSEVRLTGGTADAGLPQGAQLTALITLNNRPIEESPPYFDAHNVLPIIAANQGETTGGLYYDAADGRLRPLPSYNLALPVTDLCVDNEAGTIYIGTTHGVWGHDTTNLPRSTTPWAPVGGLPHPIKRLTFVGGTPAVLIALVSGVSAAADGVYQYNVTSPSSAVGTGYDHWVRLSSKPDLIDTIATDAHSFFYLDKADSAAALWFHDGSAPTAPGFPWTLGEGVQGTRLDRVIVGVGDDQQDSVWVSCAGGTQAAQYLVFPSVGGWIAAGLLPADFDGSLSAAVGQQTGTAVQPQVNRVVALGYGINGVTIAVLLCTQVGIYAMAGASLPTTDGGSGWDGAPNGMNGIGGLSITQVVAGQPTSIPDPYNPATSVQANRLYAISGTSLFYSYSDARYWRDRLRDPLTLAPYFYAAAALELAGALPDWGVQTIGPMASSPIGGPDGSHIQITHSATQLPAGWYWRRHYGGPTDEPYFGLVNSTVPWPTAYVEQVSEVAVTLSVGMEAASGDLAAFFIILLGERSRRSVSLNLSSSFTQQESGLRWLWPSHQAAAKQQGIIAQVSETGHYVGTTYLNLDGTEVLYVLAHTIQGDGPVVTTTTTLAPSIAGLESGSDLAAALVQDLRRIRIGVRSKH